MALSFKEKREKFYNEIPEYWANMYGEEYSLLDILEINEKQIIEKNHFAFESYKIFSKTAELLTGDLITDEMLLELGFPKKTIPYLRLKTTKSKTIIGRFDSVLTDDGHKILEFNSDTPTFIKELFYINGLVCNKLGFENPNQKEEEKLAKVIKNAIFESYSFLEKKEYPNVIFTSHEENIEDKNTVLYLKKLFDMPSKYVPLNKLHIIKNKGLFDNDGKKIDVLYRQTFPIENLIEDKGAEDDSEIGVMLLDLVKEKKLALINPPSAFLMQNKALMAIIWGLHEENNPFFSKEEHEVISKYFLPTYLEPDEFVKNKEKYVKKPVFGREGDTVEIYHPNGNLVIEDENKTYANYVSIYQKYVDLPVTDFETEKGVKRGHVMVGTFIIDGKPSSFGCRVGNQITDNLSYYLPIGLKNK